MPQTVYTAFDTGGQTKLTDMDQVAEQRRREMQDQAFRGALLNNQNNMQREGWNRQDALTQQGLTAQERIAAANNANQLAMGGSFQDRTAANQQLAQMQMRPAQTMADLEANKWKEGSGLRESGNALTQEINTAKLNAIRGGMGGQGAGNSRLAAALMGINPDQLEDPQDRMMKQALNQALAARLASGELDPAQFKAAAGGDLSAIPQKQASSISPEMQMQALQEEVGRFGSKDAATFGLDPGDEDITRILAQRDAVAKSIRMQNPRISPEQATQDANFRIEQGLRPFADRWGTGWVQKLRQVMGGAQGGPVVEAGGSEFFNPGTTFSGNSALLRR